MASWAPPTTAPLLLIPGAFMATDSMKQWVAAFVAKRPVIVFDQQGHGRTADTPREMSYEQFADDAAALLRALEVERADVMGYSQGGGVALQLAMRHPPLVSKLVSLSATYRKDGWYPSVLARRSRVSPANPSRTRPSTRHSGSTRRSRGVRRLPREDEGAEHRRPEHQRREMRSIPAKTMVIVGDADGVKPEHALAMFKLRGGGDEEAAATGAISKVPQARLVILPATSHISISALVQVLEPMITEFLDDVPPATPSLW